MDKTAERYSLLRKLSMSEPDSRTLEISFALANSQQMPLLESGQQRPVRQLKMIIISPCPASHTKVDPPQHSFQWIFAIDVQRVSCLADMCDEQQGSHSKLLAGSYHEDVDTDAP